MGGGIKAHLITWGDMLSLMAILAMSSIVVDGIAFGIIDKAKPGFLSDPYGNPPPTLSGKGAMRGVLRYILLSLVVISFLIGLENSKEWKNWFTFGSPIKCLFGGC